MDIPSVLLGKSLAKRESGGSVLNIEILDELPETGVTGVLYLISKEGSTSEEGNYNKYVWVERENEFVYLGDTHVEVDVSAYVKKSAFDYDGETETLTITID